MEVLRTWWSKVCLYELPDPRGWQATQLCGIDAPLEGLASWSDTCAKGFLGQSLGDGDVGGRLGATFLMVLSSIDIQG